MEDMNGGAVGRGLCPVTHEYICISQAGNDEIDAHRYFVNNAREGREF